MVHIQLAVMQVVLWVAHGINIVMMHLLDVEKNVYGVQVGDLVLRIFQMVLLIIPPHSTISIVNTVMDITDIQTTL